MKRYYYFVKLLMFAATVALFSCEKGKVFDDLDTDAPAWAGGNTELNSNSKTNTETGITRGEDYGDLYVLKRLESGVPEMALTSAGVWYAKAVAFDEYGNAVYDGNEYATLSVNDEGEVNDSEYQPKEVEFGRMNLVRAPQSVLASGLQEAISALITANRIKTDFCGRLVAINGAQTDWLPESTEADDKTIDSPRENMAIYQELMRNGLEGALSFLKTYGFGSDDILPLAASALAAGSDKTGQITLDEVVYINGFMDAYDETDCINLAGIEFDDGFCDDPYYSYLKFYDYSWSYDRAGLHGAKQVKITVLNSDGSYEIQTKKLIDEVEFTETRIDMAHSQNMDLAGFTQACDDAVQLLEFVHESSLVEYIGEEGEVDE